MTQTKARCHILLCSAWVHVGCKTGYGFQETNAADQAAGVTGASFDALSNHIRAIVSKLIWQDL